MENGVFVKDLSTLDVDLKDVVFVDNRADSYQFQPECGIPISNFYYDKKCTALYDLIPVLQKLSQIDDCREAIQQFVKDDVLDYGNAEQVLDEIIEREEE